MAIAANDKLVEQYQDFLFAEENLSLLPLLVGGQKYIEAFIEKFHGTDGVYGRLKGQAIQLVEPNKIDFFSATALRKEQELLNAVFVEYVLRDFGQVLKTSKPDPLYGVLETASLIKNEEFITIVLDAFERYINELTKKSSTEELLKKSFATLLETAISQEHISVIEYLCKRYTNSADHAIYDVYKQAFTDDKVITILRQQILKNIGARGRKEIYDLILKTALDAGNIAFIEHLCKECAECVNDVINYLDHKSKNNEFDEIYESILIALSNVEYTNTDVILEVLFYTKEIHQNVSHNEQVIRQVIQNILKNATHCSIGQEDYSLVKGVCYLCTEIDAINIIFQEECKIFKSSIEKRIEDLEKENKLLQSEALREYNYSYLPGIVNGLAQTACIVYDEYTKDPKDNKRQENTDLILSLMQIRNILQFSIDVQEYPCHEREDWWDKMDQTSGTFIIRKRSNNVADELAIPVITSDILSENPGLESAGSKQPQENVDKGENIMNNEKASIEELISNNFEEGEMAKRHGKPLAAFVQQKISKIISKGNDNLNLEEEFKDVLKNGNHNLVLKYVKNQEGSLSKDKVVEFLTQYIENKKNDIQINGKQSTNPHNGSVTEPVQPAPPENASLYVNNTEDVTNSEDRPVINGASNDGVFELEVKSNQSNRDDECSSTSSDASDASTIKAAGDFEDKQPNSSPLLPQSSVSGDEHSGSSPSFINVPTSDEGDTDNSNSEVSSEDITKEGPTLKGSSSLQDIQPEISVSSSSVSPNVDDVPTIEEHMVITADIEQRFVGDEVSSIADDLCSEASTEDDVSSLGVADDECSEVSSEDDTQNNISQPTRDSGKNDTAPQNTQKSKLPTVVTWTLAVAGVLAGVAASVAYFAFGASLLVAGITAGVGAWCLVAAAVMYCFNRPASSLSNVKYMAKENLLEQ